MAIPGDQLQSLFIYVLLTAESTGPQQQESGNTEALVAPLAGSAASYLAVSADSLSGNRPRWKSHLAQGHVTPKRQPTSNDGSMSGWKDLAA